MEKIKKAHDFALAAHHGQKRKFTGEDYIVHPEETAQFLWEATNGEAALEDYIAALLHDVVEDTPVTTLEIGREFGKKVMDLVAELTTDNEKEKAETKKLYLTRKMIAMSDPALSIKLCDRFSNVVDLSDERVPKNFVSRYTMETQYILIHLNRALNDTQIYLTKKIGKMLVFLKLNRNL